MLRNYIIKMIMISEVIKKLKQLKIEIKEKNITIMTPYIVISGGHS